MSISQYKPLTQSRTSNKRGIHEKKELQFTKTKVKHDTYYNNLYKHVNTINIIISHNNQQQQSQ